MKLEFQQTFFYKIIIELFKAAIILKTEVSIQEYRSKELEQALKIEKKKRIYSKHLNLIKKEGGRAFL